MTTEDMLRRACEASAAAPPVGHDAYRLFVKAVRDLMDEHWERILDCNARDLDRARDQGLPEPLIQRLRLTDRQKTALECACNSIERDLPRDETAALIHGDDGIRSRKVLRPLGVILMIFEARAEIALRAAAMCAATGNAVLLRGGSEISQTISAVGDLLETALADAGLPRGLLSIVNSTDRAQLRELLRRDDAIDVIIPRGGPSLIEHCRTASRIPLIASGGGANHVYIHRSANPYTAVRLVLDAKLRDPAACTAVEMVLIDEQMVEPFLAALAETPDTEALMLRVPEDLTVPHALRGKIDQIPLSAQDNGREFLSPTLAVRPVPDADAAIEHVNRHGSGHTEGVLTTDPAVSEDFARRVDAATVVVNGSLLLNDAPLMGLGTALAISTARLHVRGPVTLTALYTHSWIVDGADTAHPDDPGRRNTMTAENTALSKVDVSDAVKRMLIAESRITLDPAALRDDEPLVGPVLNVSSFGFIGMLIRLEDELGVNLPDDLFVNHTFTTVADIVSIVAEGADRHHAKSAKEA